MLVKAGRFCAGKTSRCRPPRAASNRGPGVILQQTHGGRRGGDAGAPPWVSSESCPVLAAGRRAGWGRAGGTPGLPRAALGPQFCSKHNQIKETGLEITCLDRLHLHAGHANRGRSPSRGTLGSLSLVMLCPRTIPTGPCPHAGGTRSSPAPAAWHRHTVGAEKWPRLETSQEEGEALARHMHGEGRFRHHHTQTILSRPFFRAFW